MKLLLKINKYSKIWQNKMKLENLYLRKYFLLQKKKIYRTTMKRNYHKY